MVERMTVINKAQEAWPVGLFSFLRPPNVALKRNKLGHLERRKKSKVGKCKYKQIFAKQDQIEVTNADMTERLVISLNLLTEEMMFLIKSI